MLRHKYHKKATHFFLIFEVHWTLNRDLKPDIFIGYTLIGVTAVRLLRNRLAIIENTRNITNIKLDNALQSGSRLDIGPISYKW